MSQRCKWLPKVVHSPGQFLGEKGGAFFQLKERVPKFNLLPSPLLGFPRIPLQATMTKHFRRQQWTDRLVEHYIEMLKLDELTFRATIQDSQQASYGTDSRWTNLSHHIMFLKHCFIHTVMNHIQHTILFWFELEMVLTIVVRSLNYKE